MALEDLIETLRNSIAASYAAIERAQEVRGLRLAGESFSKIAADRGRPLAVERVSAIVEALVLSSAKLRRAHAKVLHAEGLTMEQIADLFGVTRQRVSAILRSAE